jgi:tetratricopeptide (TPR) repeat protein
MYTLIVAVPRSGELKRTIVVGPSLADAKGRISVELLFEPKPVSEESHQVSVSQLAIPENAQAEYDRAMARLEKREVDKAVEHLERAVKLAPRFSGAWNHLGTIAYQSKKYAEAERHFRESLRHDPEAYAPLVNLGGALLSLGKSEESLPINQRAVEARPDDALAHSQLGQSYFYLGRVDDAIKHLKQAKALDAAHFSHPQIVLAEIYARRGDLGSLILELEEFIRLHPDSNMAPGIRKGIERARELRKQAEPSKPLNPGA